MPCMDIDNVFKNEARMCLEVGVAVCESYVSTMTDEQAMCLN